MLIKPFMATVDGTGKCVATIQHNIHGLVWKVFQIGIALGQVALTAQCAAHVNGIPLTSTVIMQQSAFAQFPTNSPYAMESFMVGPPYINLDAGDFIQVAVINATAGDVLTVGAYVEERDSTMPQTMGS